MKEFIEKLIGRLEELREENDWNNNPNDEYSLGGFVATKRAIQTINELAEEYNNGWIPCSRELPPQPEENPVFENKPLELYLVTVKNTEYSFRAFWNGKFFTDGWSKLDVIAWQPLPVSYKKGE